MAFYWSASKLNAANYCRMRYWLRYIVGEPEARVSAYVKGSFVHSLIENFWNFLGTPEQVEADLRNNNKKSGEKRHFFDSSSFIEYAKGKWNNIIRADNELRDKFNCSDEEERKKLQTDLILWRDDSEKYTILNTLHKYCVPLFNYFLKEGPPVKLEKFFQYLQEVSFEFDVFGERFLGKIDEVRLKPDGTIVIRDYKSGSPWVDDMKLEFDPQLTLYNPGLLSLCYNDEDICNALGLERKVIRENMNRGIFVNPLIEEQFYMIEAPGIDILKVSSVPKLIYSTQREQEHFYGLIAMAKGVKKLTNPPDIIYGEWGKKCSACGMKAPCKKRAKDIGQEFRDKKEHGFFSFSKPFYVREAEKMKREIKKQKSKGKFKDRNQLQFKLAWKSSDYVSGKTPFD